MGPDRLSNFGTFHCPHLLPRDPKQADKTFQRAPTGHEKTYGPEHTLLLGRWTSWAFHVPSVRCDMEINSRRYIHNRTPGIFGKVFWIKLNVFATHRNEKHQCNHVWESHGWATCGFNSGLSRRCVRLSNSYMPIMASASSRRAREGTRLLSRPWRKCSVWYAVQHEGFSFIVLHGYSPLKQIPNAKPRLLRSFPATCRLCHQCYNPRAISWPGVYIAHADVLNLLLPL